MFAGKAYFVDKLRPRIQVKCAVIWGDNSISLIWISIARKGNVRTFLHGLIITAGQFRATRCIRNASGRPQAFLSSHAKSPCQ